MDESALPDARLERGSRRAVLQWLGVSALGLTGGTTCRPRPDPRFADLRFRLDGQVVTLRVEQRLRPGPLQANDTVVLRRYRGHGDARAREAQLVLLASVATFEEAFLHTRPDDTWTEVGFRTERGANPWQSHGVRLLPLPVLLDLWSGRHAGFRRPTAVVNYHVHPVPFVRRTLRRLGRDARLERLLYLPSAGDLFVHARLRLGFATLGATLRSRVATPDALVEYDVADALATRIHASASPAALRELQVYEAARLAYAHHDISRSYFLEVLRGRLREEGLPEDLVRLTVDTRVPVVR